MYNYGVAWGFEAKLQYRFGKKNIREAVAGASGSIGLSTRLRVGSVGEKSIGGRPGAFEGVVRAGRLLGLDPHRAEAVAVP